MYFLGASEPRGVSSLCWTRCTSTKGWAPTSAPSRTFLHIIVTPCFERNDCPNKMLSLTHLFSFILLKNNQEHMHRPLWTSAGTRGPGTRSNRTSHGLRRTQICILPLRLGLHPPGQVAWPLRDAVSSSVNGSHNSAFFLRFWRRFDKIG